MALYAIADLHLSLGTDKPMDVFRGWENYVERLEKNWRALVTEEDTVVIADAVADERITACRSGGQYIPFGQLK